MLPPRPPAHAVKAWVFLDIAARIVVSQWLVIRWIIGIAVCDCRLCLVTAKMVQLQESIPTCVS